jgi:hypothetical protein
MIYPPVYIIYTQACKYLSEEEKAELIKKINKLKRMYGKQHLKVILEHFDVELFKDKPIIPEDIYLYNYIKYDITEKALPRSGLIQKYERSYFTR